MNKSARMAALEEQLEEAQKLTDSLLTLYGHEREIEIEVVHLKGEVARLRSALQTIADGKYEHSGSHYHGEGCSCADRYAADALAETGEEAKTE